MKIRHKAPHSHQECDQWLQVRAFTGIRKKGEKIFFLGVSPDRGDTIALLLPLGCLYLPEL